MGGDKVRTEINVCHFFLMSILTDFHKFLNIQHCVSYSKLHKRESSKAVTGIPVTYWWG